MRFPNSIDVLLFLSLVSGAACRSASAQVFSVGVARYAPDCAPVPAVVERCAPEPIPCPAPPVAKVWIPGHYEVVVEPVWVPGCSRRVWIEPIYRTAYDRCGRKVQICTKPGHWRVIEEPGRYESRRVRVWVAGCWR